MSAPDMLHAALAYAAKGWRVFPCHTPILTPGRPPRCSCSKAEQCAQMGKHPRTLNGLSDASNDPEKIRRWWTTFPDANIGGLPASAGLLAFDLDSDASNTAARELGLFAEPTQEVITGNGVHRYYRHPVPLPSGATVRGIIVRSGHGYVMLPPSLHKNGTRYRWEPEGGEILELPPKALGAVQDATSRSGAKERVKIAATTDRITAGERHSALLAMAGSLAARRVPAEMALPLVLDMNANRCDPPKEPSEVQRIVEFAYGKELAKPAPAPLPEPPPMEWAPITDVPPDVLAELNASDPDTPHTAAEDDARTAALPRPSRVREALAVPYTLDQWSADLIEMRDGVPTGFDVLDDPGIGMRWLPGKVTAVIARPGAGKTAFLLEACARYVERHPDHHAVFLSWEEPLADVVSRLIHRAAARSVWQGAAFSASRLPSEAVRGHGRGEPVDPKYAERIDHARAYVQEMLTRLHLVDGDQLGRDVRSVLRDVAAWMREDGAPAIGLVALDYFQKLHGAPGAHSRQAELQDVSDVLRRFAKGAALSGEHDAHHPQFAVPVIVGAQVNRTATSTTKDGKVHPTGDDIREADDLLNDAAAVVSLSWEAVSGGTDDDPPRVLRIAVPKHRGGRARGTMGEETARIPWYPARHFLADQALRDHATQRIAWAKPRSEPDLSTEDATAMYVVGRGSR